MRIDFGKSESSNPLDSLKRRMQSSQKTVSTTTTTPQIKKEEIPAESDSKSTLLERCRPYTLDDEGHDLSKENHPLYKLESVAEILKSDSEKALEALTNIMAQSDIVGNAFANGPLKTIDPVKHEKLNGSWMKLVAKHQKYQMHTRVVTYTTTVNGKPRTRTRTETYWSWDTFKREIKTATTVNFLGVDIPYRKFSFIDSSDKRFTISTGHNRRIVFICTPTEMSGTIFTTFANKQISDNTPFYVGWNIDRTYKHYTNSCSVMIFWICWIALIIGILSIYFVAENNWLED
jgi:hypothetical protein